ncbi:MAG TPA: UDP-N-acetylmuramate dehydrogenase [bacterium]|nr:UDP-N-acetylmuramate dehydrogenase [bacterium]
MAAAVAAELTQRYGTRVRCAVPLATLTTFGIGGPAELLFAATTAAELTDAVMVARRAGMPVLVLGGGSNVLADDAGWRGLVVLDRTSGLAFAGTTVTAVSGTATARLALATARAGLAGLEFAGGICGTVGGAVRGNAGAYGRGIGDALVRATLLLPDGTTATVGRDWFGFAYRHSRLADEPATLLLDATWELAAGDAAALQQVIIDDRARRLEQHPYGFGCAGSFFRNLPPLPGGERKRAAGELLDRAGAKGQRAGGAEIFRGHANFIINTGGATAADVKELAQRAQRLVRDLCGENLHPEVQFLGAQ